MDDELTNDIDRDFLLVLGRKIQRKAKEESMMWSARLETSRIFLSSSSVQCHYNVLLLDCLLFPSIFFPQYKKMELLCCFVIMVLFETICP